MSDIAFHGNAETKAMALARLRAHIAAGTFVFFPAWEDGKANVIGALVEADDKQAFAEQFGYPLPLATALEVIVNAFHVLPAAQEFADEFVAQTPVGADLSLVVPRLLIHLLELPDVVTLSAQHDEVDHWRREVVALHRATLAGDMPGRKEWKAARLAAVATSDAVTGQPFVQLVSQVVEAAAWPCTMRTVLYDTLGACGRLESQLMMERIGWTMEEEHRVFKIREEAETSGRMAELSGLDRVLALLDQDDPELAAGFRLRLEHFGSLGAFYREIGREMIAIFNDVPVVAPEETKAE